ENTGELEALLTVGMSKERVASIVGEPHNNDTHDIWMWSEVGTGGDWKTMTRESNCLFLVFKKGKLKYPDFFRSTDVDPNEILIR
ncbi:MAG: hypothetical protein AAF394_16060, partial [Planctomycetota bacterium]